MLQKTSKVIHPRNFPMWKNCKGKALLLIVTPAKNDKYGKLIMENFAISNEMVIWKSA